jgi:hypothetical protein
LRQKRSAADAGRIIRKLGAFAESPLAFESIPPTDFHPPTGADCYNRHMTDAIGTALGGIQRSTSQFAKSAENVVNATRPGSTEDPAKAIVDSKTASYAFKANVAVLKTADKMLGALLDTLA